ncbi:unnamed protein product, partial [Allacma fusca]
IYLERLQNFTGQLGALYLDLIFTTDPASSTNIARRLARLTEDLLFLYAFTREHGFEHPTFPNRQELGAQMISTIRGRLRDLTPTTQPSTSAHAIANVAPHFLSDPVPLITHSEEPRASTSQTPYQLLRIDRGGQFNAFSQAPAAKSGKIRSKASQTSQPFKTPYPPPARSTTTIIIPFRSPEQQKGSRQVTTPHTGAGTTQNLVHIFEQPVSHNPLLSL